jgi:predicted  nucleic acid-binding Zn-ribbon protein
MFAEDEYLKALTDRDNKISFFQEQLEKTSEQLEKTSEQLEKTSEQLENERRLNQEKDEALDSEKSKNRQLQIVVAKMHKEKGLTNDEIQSKTGLPIDLTNEI